ncbi:ribosome maturation factor RimP [Plasticicumulans acidivorans]|uniref:ribosome maturation factor RimP n=1 Tax=Plasticicumulans acidivorans TaxID=886464 RepID=UPI000D709FE2|nr:ribosome maturation factor RimP [Plasticicumulans acidivorans]
MRSDPYQLRELLGPSIEKLGYELVGIEFHPNSYNALLRIYIDSKNGICVDDCQQVSQQVSGLLDVSDPIPGHYTLEVSSPGLDRPLFTAAHFERFKGRQAKIQLGLALDGRRRFSGMIKEVHDGEIIFQCDGVDLTIAIDRIETARLVPEY